MLSVLFRLIGQSLNFTSSQKITPIIIESSKGPQEKNVTSVSVPSLQGS